VYLSFIADQQALMLSETVYNQAKQMYLDI